MDIIGRVTGLLKIDRNKSLEEVLEREPDKIIDNIYMARQEILQELNEVYEQYKQLPDKNDLKPSEVKTFNEKIDRLFADFYWGVIDNFDGEYSIDENLNDAANEAIRIRVMENYKPWEEDKTEIKGYLHKFMAVDRKLREISKEKKWDVPSLFDLMYVNN